MIKIGDPITAEHIDAVCEGYKNKPNRRTMKVADLACSATIYILATFFYCGVIKLAWQTAQLLLK